MVVWWISIICAPQKKHHGKPNSLFGTVPDTVPKRDFGLPWADFVDFHKINKIHKSLKSAHGRLKSLFGTVPGTVPKSEFTFWHCARHRAKKGLQSPMGGF